MEWVNGKHKKSNVEAKVQQNSLIFEQQIKQQRNASPSQDAKAKNWQSIIGNISTPDNVIASNRISGKRLNPFENSILNYASQ